MDVAARIGTLSHPPLVVKKPIGPWLLLDSGVLHLMDGMEALDVKRLFPKILPQSRPLRKAYKNKLFRKN